MRSRRQGKWLRSWGWASIRRKSRDSRALDSLCSFCIAAAGFEENVESIAKVVRAREVTGAKNCGPSRRGAVAMLDEQFQTTLWAAADGQADISELTAVS